MIKWKEFVGASCVVLSFGISGWQAKAQTPIYSTSSSNQSVTQATGTSLSVNHLAIPSTGSLTLAGIPFVASPATSTSGGSIVIGAAPSDGDISGPWLGTYGISVQDQYGNSAGMFIDPAGLLRFQGLNNGMVLDTSAQDGPIALLEGDGNPVEIADYNSYAWSGNAQPSNAIKFFCAETADDWVGVGSGTPGPCKPFDIFDVSNREAFGDGYMHWYLDGVSWAGNAGVPNPGWNAGISNPSAGVLSFDTTSNGNAGATIKVAKIIFPDTSFITSAPSSISSVGTVTSGVWNGTPLTSAYLPSDVAYTDASPQTFTGATSFSNSVGIGTASPPAPLTVASDSVSANGEKLVVQRNGAGDVGVSFQQTGIDAFGIVQRSGNGNGLAFVENYYEGNAGTEVLRILGNGNVGIGTNTPGTDLAGLTSPPATNAKIFEVNGDIALSYHSGSSMYFQDGSQQTTAWNGTTFGGDYAESVDVLGDRQTYEPGDVIVIDDQETGKFNKSDKAYSRMVAGVYSTKPGLVGRRTTAARPDQKDEVPMAMMGIAPTKVSAENGPIVRGDLLVSSGTPGYAMKGTDRDQLTGAVIGKALAPLKSGTGVIEVLITLQ